MRVALAFAALALLVGCDAIDRPAMTTFDTSGPATFIYKAKSDVVYPDTSSGAEADRMRWLAKYLSDNGLCPGGYAVDTRKSIVIQGPIHEITYRGHCT